MKISINRKAHTPVYAQIRNDIRQRILSGELANGFKLPAERTLAANIGVHRNTIVKAYEELISEDLIKSSISPRGYFVTYSQPADFKRGGSFKSSRYPGALSFMLKEEYLQMDNLFAKLFYSSGVDSPNVPLISMAADIITPDLYPRKQLNQILSELSEKGRFDWCDFAPSQGLPQLIQSIQSLLEKRHIHVSPKEIQIVGETYEALQFAARIFLSARDTIICEEPISPDMLQVLQSLALNVITIPMDENGMQTQYLEGLIVKYRPRMIYTIPTFHFPTNTIMSLSRRYELLELSYKYDIPIVEEDCDSVLRYEGVPIPSLKSLDTMGNVIYVNSFIATICPGVRVGYMVAPERTVNRFSMLMENSRIFVNPIGQYLASEFIKKGYIYDHIDTLCDFGKKNRDCLCSALSSYDEIAYRFQVPKGGTALWCCLDEDINPQALLYKAHELGISYMPGDLFFPFMNKGDNFLRLAYGNVTEEEIAEGVGRLSAAVAAVRGRR
ncbi:PLP-dependent aminotransferase family protein [Anaerovoracaceae bacterium 41-7]